MRTINIPREKLEELYLNPDLTIKTIAKELGISQRTLMNKRKEFGLHKPLKVKKAKYRVFSKLSKVLSHDQWRLDLIEKFRERVSVNSYRLQPIFPGQDVEANCMTALYLAAMTFEPERNVTFYTWLMNKLRGQRYDMRRKHKKNIITTYLKEKKFGTPY